MNRLTIRNSDGSVSRPTHSTFERVFNKLAAYEDAEEQKMFVWLPCKIGDIVYSTFHGCIKAAKVRRIMVEFGPETDGSCITHMQVCRVGGACEEFRLSDVGERLFLTREEAEKALEGAQV